MLDVAGRARPCREERQVAGIGRTRHGQVEHHSGHPSGRHHASGDGEVTGLKGLPRALGGAEIDPGVEDAGRTHRGVALPTDASTVVEPADDVEHQTGAGSDVVVQLHRAGGADRDDGLIGDGLTSDPVERRGRRARAASGEQRGEARTRGVGAGEVHDHGRHPAGRHRPSVRHLYGAGLTGGPGGGETTQADTGIENAGRFHGVEPIGTGRGDGGRRCGKRGALLVDRHHAQGDRHPTGQAGNRAPGRTGVRTRDPTARGPAGLRSGHVAGHG